MGVTALLAAFVPPAVVAVSASASSDTVLIGSGSSAAQPYMLRLFAAYHRIHREIAFRYTPDGGNAGVKDVQDGISQFAVQTAAPTASQTGVTFSKIFLDALCIDVNSKNRLRNLSIGRLGDIFAQPPSVTRWSQLPGSGLGSQTILTQGRDSAAGQFTFFQSAVLDGRAESTSTSQLTSDGLVRVAIQHNADAIGYVGLADSGIEGEAKAPGERAISIDGITCSIANVRKRKYPLWRYDWSVVPAAHPSGAVLRFFQWVRTSRTAGKVIAGSGAVPAFNR